jgi:hypothetical protein
VNPSSTSSSAKQRQGHTKSTQKSPLPPETTLQSAIHRLALWHYANEQQNPEVRNQKTEEKKE